MIKDWKLLLLSPLCFRPFQRRVHSYLLKKRTCWSVLFEFNAILTAKIILWRSVTHMCFLAFSNQYKHNFSKSPTTFLTCFCRSERRKYARKKVRLNRGSSSQRPCHESDTLTTEPTGWGEAYLYLLK